MCIMESDLAWVHYDKNIKFYKWSYKLGLGQQVEQNKDAEIFEMDINEFRSENFVNLVVWIKYH